MSASKEFWRMTKGRILEGVFAVNKPKMITSAQVIRDLQEKFQPSKLFAPYLENARKVRARENHNQRQRRREKNIKVKIGHGGTLDPLATGVLILGIGSGTKSLSDFLSCTKEYEAVILFGTSTDTYDRVGRVLKRSPYEHITRQMVEDALPQFRGKYMQLPPLFSALKMNGKPLYEYAREGKDLPRDIERRSVEVLNLEIVEWMEGGMHSHEAPSEDASPAEVNVANKLWKQEGVQPTGKDADVTTAVSAEFENKKRKLSENQDNLVQERPISKRRLSESQDTQISGGLTASTKATPTSEIAVESSSKLLQAKGPPAARIRMTVTSGFYVRSLCHDLGAAVGSAALMAELVRIRQGQFEIGKNALEYDHLAGEEQIWGPKIESFLDEWEKSQRKGWGETSKVSGGKSEVDTESKSSAKVENVPTPSPNDPSPGGDVSKSDAKLEGEPQVKLDAKLAEAAA